MTMADEAENDPQETEVLKEEDIGYIKNWFMLLQGKLVLTPTHLKCTAHFSAAPGMRGGLPFIKRWIEKPRYGFDLEFKDIAELTQGRMGVQKNVIKIMDSKGKKHRVLVKDYGEWEAAIKEKMGG
jgi:hypothetical protein